MKLSFIKMEATGNDFALIDATQGIAKNWARLARKVCDRHFGIGSDGLLVVQRVSAKRLKNQAAPRFRMRMFNPDGSEDMCGNGLRCVAAYLYRSGHESARTFAIQTLSGVQQAMIVMKGKEIASVKVSLGKPQLRASEIPVALRQERSEVVDYPLKVGGEQLLVTALSTGTPHAVIFPSKPVDMESLGPAIISHPFFPKETSVTFVQREAPTRLRARTWERGGVGESLSCGTGPAAVLVAAHLKGLVPRESKVSYPGGVLQVRWDCEGDLWIAGPATHIFSVLLET